MEIEFLRDFTVIAQLESFSRAAEELSISQSSLSKHMLALERELGVSLLERTSRSVALSRAGANILPLATQICAMQNQIRLAADREVKHGKQFLKIASIPVMAQYDITGTIARFQKNHPEVNLEVMECEQHDLLSALRSGGCELAFSRVGPALETDMVYTTYREDYMVAVIPRAHPLAKRDTVTMEDLRTEPLLLMDQRTGLFNLCSMLCSEAGFVPNVVYTGHRPENLVELVAQNMGIALMMKGHTDYYGSPEVACVELVPRVQREITLMHRDDARLSAPAQLFWDEIRQAGPIPVGNGYCPK